MRSALLFPVLITAFFISACGGRSSGTPTISAPDAPTGVTATAANAQVTISWTPPAGTVTRYNIYYGTAAGVTTASSTRVVGATSGAAITGLTNDTTYYFVVTAFNAGGESALSNEMTATPLAPASAPNAPAGITATAGDGLASVSWTAIAGATSYNIYYHTSAGITTANGTKVTGATSGNNIAGLTNGIPYYFIVTAVNAIGESVASSVAGAIPQVSAPGIPTGVGITVGNGRVGITWAAVAGAASYNLYYGTTAGVTTANGTKVGATTSGSTIFGLVNGSTYYFVVTAVNAGGESATSGEVNAMPQLPVTGAPTGISAAAGNGQITVSWGAVSGATSYNVYYSTAAGVSIANATRVGGVTSGSAITGLANGTPYYLVVTAVNAGGESAISNEINSTPLIPVPVAPTGVSASAGDRLTTISWGTVTGATSYNLYYGASPGITTASFTKIIGATSGSVITGLTNGTNYYFVVTAVNSRGESVLSSEVSAMPISPPGVWTTKTPMVNPRDNAANAVLNGKIYVLGGAPAGISILDSMEMYEPTTDTWTTKAPMPAWSPFAITPPWAAYGTLPSLPAYRYSPAAAPVNGLIYLVGGTSLVNGQGPIYTTALYDPNTNSWSNTVPVTVATTAAGTAGQTLAAIPTGRWGFDIAVVDGMLYAVGGAVHVPGNIFHAENTVTITGATSTSPVVDPAGTTITGLDNWSHYYFLVTAVDINGIESAPAPGASALLRQIYAAGEGTVSADGQATITWMKTTGSTSYNLYYSTQSGVMPLDTAGTIPAGVSRITGITATPTTASATVTGLTNGTPYYFIATAITPSGEVMATSEEVSVTPQASVAGSPSGLSVTGGDAQATLSWTPVAGAVSYNIYYGTGANIYYSTVEAYDPVANTWTTKTSMPTPRWGATASVVNGWIYAIGGWGGWPELAIVEVYDPSTDSWSSTVPVNAATTASGTAGAALKPMPTARDDFGFSVVNGIIYAIGGDINAFDDASRVSCCTTVVEAYDPVKNTWTSKTAMPTIRDDFDASLVDGVIYAIAGSRDGMFTNTGALDPAWLAANNGGFSLKTVETFSSSDIPVPNGVFTAAGTNQATISWNTVTGATSYNLYWSNKAGVSTAANSTQIANVSSPYIHTSLASGNWAYYVVTAVTATGESLPSNEVSVKP